MLYTRHIAAALDVKPSTVKHWLTQGILTARQLSSGRQRYVTPADLIVFAVDAGMTLDWEAVIDVD